MTYNRLSSNSDENTSSIQGTDSIKLVLYVYNLELNNRNISTLTKIDKLNIVDNNTGRCDEQNDVVGSKIPIESNLLCPHLADYIPIWHEGAVPIVTLNYIEVRNNLNVVLPVLIQILEVPSHLKM